jgi:hypothetical protein
MTSDELTGCLQELGELARLLVPEACHEELGGVLDYQRAVLPEYATIGQSFNVLMRRNFHDYFQRLYTSTPVELTPETKLMVSSYRRFANLSEYAREVVIYGRKSNTMLRTIQAV